MIYIPYIYILYECFSQYSSDSCAARNLHAAWRTRLESSIKAPLSSSALQAKSPIRTRLAGAAEVALCGKPSPLNTVYLEDIVDY